jgi:DHA1 family multidrug resistance protein-like MFS transporter
LKPSVNFELSAAIEASRLFEMADIIRDSAFGQLVRLATGNRYFLYEEEKPGFKIPDYGQRANKSEKVEESATPGTEDPSRSRTDVATDSAAETVVDTPNTGTALTQMTHVPSPVDVEKALSSVDGDDGNMGSVMAPKRTENGTVLIDWYSDGGILKS